MNSTIGSILFLLMIAVCSNVSFAGNKLPFNPEMTAKIQEIFFGERGISREKIDQYLQGISARARQMQAVVRNDLKVNEQLTGAKLKKEVKGEDNIQLFAILIKLVKKLREESDPIAAHRLAADIIELDYALKIEGDQLESVRTYNYVKEQFRTWAIEKKTLGRVEASNLLNPENNTFYSQDELQEMAQMGADLSAVDPDPQSGFWKNPGDISKMDLKQSNHHGRDALHQGLTIVFPEENRAFFKKVRKSQSKPKIDVFVYRTNKKGKLKKKTFKLKVGLEIHSEPTVTALISALGYSADAVTYVRDFKMYLGEVSYADFKKDWDSYYGGYDLEKYIKETGKDEKGHFVTWTEGMLEDKIKENSMRVGPWAWGKNGHRDQREVRALLLFNMWVANADLKEAENNKMILREKNGNYQQYFIQHDMGFAIGDTFREKPGAYPWNLVKGESTGAIHFNYKAFQKNSGFTHVTFADAKWMVRLIAQLNRTQMTDAVSLGHWPRSVDKLVTEKLISRRNQLVQAFGLAGEGLADGTTITLIEADQRLTTEDGVVVNGQLKQAIFEGYTQDFGHSFQEGWRPVQKMLENLSLQVLRLNVNSASSMKIEPESMGLESEYVAKISLNLDRSVSFNPQPVSDDDAYLVKDTFTIGFRLGYGLVLGGDVSLKKKYTLVYPVRTKEEGEYQGNFFINLFMPYQVLAKKFPKRHMLITEDYIIGRGKIRVGLNEFIQFSPFDVSASAGLSLVLLNRSIINHKNPDKIVVYQDGSNYNEFTAKISAQLAHLKLPLVKIVPFSEGEINRYVYDISTQSLDDNDTLASAMDDLIRYNDVSAIREHGVRKRIHSAFEEQMARLGFLTFIDMKSSFRVDDMEIEVYDAATNAMVKKNRWQMESDRMNSWQVLDNGEKHLFNVLFTSDYDKTTKALENPYLHLHSYHNDSSTKNHEMELGYLSFINGAAQDDRFLDYTPSLHTVNYLWGHTYTYLDIYYYQEAIDDLLTIDREAFWNGLARALDIQRSELDSERQKFVSMIRTHNFRRFSGLSPRMFSVLNHAYIFLTNLKKASLTDDKKEQMEYLTRAMKYTTWKWGASFEAVILGAVNNMLGADKFYLKGMISMPSSSEKKLPARKDIVNEMGKKQHQQDDKVVFSTSDTLEIYNLFN